VGPRTRSCIAAVPTPRPHRRAPGEGHEGERRPHEVPG
jgi:hypothetical protein